MPGGDTFLNGRRQKRNIQVNKICIMAFSSNSFGPPVLVADP